MVTGMLQYLPILNTPPVSSIKRDRYLATANRRIKHEHTTTAFGYMIYWVSNAVILFAVLIAVLT